MILETIESLQKENEILETEILNIKNQIVKAQQGVKTKGKYSDCDWYRKANYAMAIKKNQIKANNRKINMMNRRAKEEEKVQRQKDIERVFVDICKEKFDSDTFGTILEEALIRTGNTK